METFSPSFVKEAEQNTMFFSKKDPKINAAPIMLRQSLPAAGTSSFQRHSFSSRAPSTAASNQSLGSKATRTKIDGSPTKKWLAKLNENTAIIPEDIFKIKSAGSARYAKSVSLEHRRWQMSRGSQMVSALQRRFWKCPWPS